MQSIKDKLSKFRNEAEDLRDERDAANRDLMQERARREAVGVGDRTMLLDVYSMAIRPSANYRIFFYIYNTYWPSLLMSMHVVTL